MSSLNGSYDVRQLRSKEVKEINGRRSITANTESKGLFKNQHSIALNKRAISP